jgi:hypothetical protein
MSDDPIIAEIHRIREQIWAECHGNSEELAERLRHIPIPPNMRRFNHAQFKQQFRADKAMRPD